MCLGSRSRKGTVLRACYKLCAPANMGLRLGGTRENSRLKANVPVPILYLGSRTVASPQRCSGHATTSIFRHCR